MLYVVLLVSSSVVVFNAQGASLYLSFLLECSLDGTKITENSQIQR